MAASKHRGKGKKVKFCCTRGTPCKCVDPHNYRTICKPSWKSYEAHHVLCVLSVKSCLAKKKGIVRTVKETQWCVNNSLNMIALPLWGHTVKWYYKSRKAPPFKNKPQHDWDHNGGGSYREEIEGELDSLAESIAESQEAHDGGTINIKTRLNNLSRTYKKVLRARGRRKGGTHKQFRIERGKPSGARPGWYEPFSMASAASEKGYPDLSFRQLVMEKVKSFFR